MKYMNGNLEFSKIKSTARNCGFIQEEIKLYYAKLRIGNKAKKYVRIKDKKISDNTK